MSEYKVYKVAPLTGALMFSNLVAVFYDLDLAKDFVNYQLTLGNSYGIAHNGSRIDLDEL